MNYHYTARDYAPYVNRARVKIKRDYESVIGRRVRREDERLMRRQSEKDKEKQCNHLTASEVCTRDA
jgi:hypothetical protein